MVKWTTPAMRDLAAQLDFIAQDNPHASQAIAIAIKKAVENLNAFPRLGREGARQGTLELVLPHLPFICVYRIIEGNVEILRLLHAKMKWPN